MTENILTRRQISRTVKPFDDRTNRYPGKVNMMKLLIAVMISSMLAAPAAAGPCDVPVPYTNVVTVEESNMSISFATDKALYGPLETVQFYLVVENIGTETFSMNWGIDPQNGIFVLPNDCLSVNQAGCYAAAAFYFPTVIYFTSDGTTLEPGECRVWTNTWDIANWGGGPPPIGTYNVFGGMFHADVDTPPGDFVLPVGGVMLNLVIDYAIPTNERTWGQVKTLYR